MKFQKINSTANAYLFKNATLSLPTQQPAISTIFDGKLVYLGFKDYGFHPMIQVLEKTNEQLYFFPKDVTQKGNDSTNFIADSNHSNAVGVFSEQQVNQAYQNSGTKFNLGDWLKSEGGKKIVNDSISLGLDLIRDKAIKNPTQTTPTPGSYQPLPEDDNKNKPSTDFWTPLTIGITAVSVIVLGAIAFKYIPKKKITK